MHGVLNVHTEHANSTQMHFLDGAPYDGTPTEAVHTVSQLLQAFYTTLSGVGLVFAMICFAFNIVFRKRRYCTDLIPLLKWVHLAKNAFFRLVKLTSPKLNLLIVLGAAMLYSCVFLYIYGVTDSGEDKLQTVLCYVCIPLTY